MTVPTHVKLPLQNTHTHTTSLYKSIHGLAGTFCSAQGSAGALHKIRGGLYGSTAGDNTVPC